MGRGKKGKKGKSGPLLLFLSLRFTSLERGGKKEKGKEVRFPLSLSASPPRRRGRKEEKRGGGSPAVVCHLLSVRHQVEEGRERGGGIKHKSSRS